MTKKAILVGIGSWGEWWVKFFLPPNIADGHVEVVAVVDKDPSGFELAQEYLEITEEQCYTDAETAFKERKADFCIVVVPPVHHETIVDLALKYDLNILSEKPIADSLEASCRIAEKVKRAGKIMGVTMSHRFDQDKTSLREQLRSGKWGKTDYLVSRFTCDCRKFGSWGDFRHRIEDPLMLEGSVHHLDLIADMTGSKCDTIYARTWKPAWAEFAGDCNGLVFMDFENGAKAVYEGAKSNAVTLNKWAHEYIRAESEKGTLVMSQRKLEVFPYDAAVSWQEGTEGQGEQIPLLEQPKWANTWLIEKYVDWLNGGEPMETNVEDNLQSVALIFAAIESSRTGKPVKVQEYLKKTREKVIAEMQ